MFGRRVRCSPCWLRKVDRSSAQTGAEWNLPAVDVSAATARARESDADVVGRGGSKPSSSRRAWQGGCGLRRTRRVGLHRYCVGAGMVDLAAKSPLVRLSSQGLSSILVCALKRLHTALPRPSMCQPGSDDRRRAPSRWTSPEVLTDADLIPTIGAM